MMYSNFYIGYLGYSLIGKLPKGRVNFRQIVFGCFDAIFIRQFRGYEFNTISCIIIEYLCTINIWDCDGNENEFQ